MEVRHNSWFDNDVYDVLTENEICLVWSQLDAIQIPAIATSDFAYVRFIGDRSIPEEEFGKIQKDRDKEMQYQAAHLKTVNPKKLKIGIVAANNHYAGLSCDCKHV